MATSLISKQNEMDDTWVNVPVLSFLQQSQLMLMLCPIAIDSINVGLDSFQNIIF